MTQTRPPKKTHTTYSLSVLKPIWHKFLYICKKKGITAGDQIIKLIEEHNNQYTGD